VEPDFFVERDKKPWYGIWIC